MTPKRCLSASLTPNNPIDGQPVSTVITQKQSPRYLLVKQLAI